jgi:hypothetical protein
LGDFWRAVYYRYFALLELGLAAVAERRICLTCAFSNVLSGQMNIGVPQPDTMCLATFRLCPRHEAATPLPGEGLAARGQGVRGVDIALLRSLEIFLVTISTNISLLWSWGLAAVAERRICLELVLYPMSFQDK